MWWWGKRHQQRLGIAISKMNRYRVTWLLGAMEIILLVIAISYSIRSNKYLRVGEWSRANVVGTSPHISVVYNGYTIAQDKTATWVENNLQQDRGVYYDPHSRSYETNIASTKLWLCLAPLLWLIPLLLVWKVERSSSSRVPADFGPRR